MGMIYRDAREILRNINMEVCREMSLCPLFRMKEMVSPMQRDA
jgi:hypothetical protein